MANQLANTASNSIPQSDEYRVMEKRPGQERALSANNVSTARASADRAKTNSPRVMGIEFIIAYISASKLELKNPILVVC